VAPNAASGSRRKARALVAAVVLAALAAGGWAWLASRGGTGEPALRTARVELGRVQVNLADAERDLARKKSLVAKNFISPAELDKAKTLVAATREQERAVEAQSAVSAAQVAAAQAAVRQREALLRQAQVDLERTIIRAPVNGTVILRNVDAGQTVAASLQAPVLFTIAQDLRDMQVEAAIDEADVGKLRVGQEASFTVDAFPRRSFSGKIRQIRKSPVNVQNVVSYTVVISAENDDLALLPGMTANVRVAVETRDNVLKVPNAALRFRPAPGKLWRPGARGEPVAVSVHTGLSDGTSTEIAEGPLKEGDEVIVAGAEPPLPAKKAGGPRIF